MALRVRRVLTCLALFVLVLFIGALGFGVYSIRRSFPQTEGELKLAGLDGPVDVYRDRDGVPHIYASTTHDLVFAQGFVHAQDRFWQMDFWRHAGSGRLSEMFGESTLKSDKFLRTLGWARVARKKLEQLDSESRILLESYAQGVNAYLSGREGSALSLEHGLLGLKNRGYKPEPWHPLHSLTWGKAMAWDLANNMSTEIARAKLLKSLTPAQAAELFPPYPADRPTIVAAPAALGRAWLPAALPAALPDPLPPLPQAEIAQLDRLLGAAGEGIGSNNWVLAGRRTATGKPIIANDPHLSAQMPSIWYEIGLHCVPKGDACPYEVAGFSFASAPGVILGHNDRIAWAFTNVGPDVEDLYVEKLNPDNPLQYEANGAWLDLQIIKETIEVAGGEPVTLDVRLTRHGPILSDTYRHLEGFDQKSGVELPPKWALALRWTALEPTITFQAIWRINRARNWDEFRDAARHFDVPSQNMLYADVDGNIGYQVPGKIPIRKNGDGRTPVPGWTDDHEWTGFIPFDELPSVYNPPQGYVVTANNAVVGPDYPYLLTHDWDYGYRAQRIVQMIEEHTSPIDLDAVQKMQGDNKNLHAAKVVAALKALPLDDERLKRARGLLEGWDFQNHMDLAAPALFETFWRRLLAATFHDELTDKDLWPAGGSRWMTLVSGLLDQPQSAWWDQKTTPAVEDRDTILLQAFAQALDEIETTLGPDPQRWSWGALHTVTFRNETLGRSGVHLLEELLNRGPFPTSGGPTAVNATSWNAYESFEVTSLPSMRTIMDLSDLDRSRAILTTGQSGHPYHAHFIDMADRWRKIEMHPMHWSRAKVEAATKGHLKLVP